VVMKV